MAIVYDKLMALKIPEVERTYTQRDPIFYALSLGLGQDPVNTDELPFVYEDQREGAADLSGGGRAARLLGARPRHRHRLGQGACMASTTWCMHKPLPPSGTRHQHRRACSTSSTRDRARAR